MILHQNVEQENSVVRGRIELPTPCFSGKGKPCELLLVLSIYSSI